MNACHAPSVTRSSQDGRPRHKKSSSHDRLHTARLVLLNEYKTLVLSTLLSESRAERLGHTTWFTRCLPTIERLLNTPFISWTLSSPSRHFLTSQMASLPIEQAGISKKQSRFASRPEQVFKQVEPTGRIWSLQETEDAPGDATLQTAEEWETHLNCILKKNLFSLWIGILELDFFCELEFLNWISFVNWKRELRKKIHLVQENSMFCYLGMEWFCAREISVKPLGTEVNLF